MILHRSNWFFRWNYIYNASKGCNFILVLSQNIFQTRDFSMVAFNIKTLFLFDKTTKKILKLSFYIM